MVGRPLDESARRPRQTGRRRRLRGAGACIPGHRAENRLSPGRQRRRRRGGGAGRVREGVPRTLAVPARRAVQAVGCCASSRTRRATAAARPAGVQGSRCALHGSLFPFFFFFFPPFFFFFFFFFYIPQGRRPPPRRRLPSGPSSHPSSSSPRLNRLPDHDREAIACRYLPRPLGGGDGRGTRRTTRAPLSRGSRGRLGAWGTNSRLQRHRAKPATRGRETWGRGRYDRAPSSGRSPPTSISPRERDLAPAVRARLRGRPARRGWIVVALAAALVTVAAAFAVPPGALGNSSPTSISREQRSSS